MDVLLFMLNSESRLVAFTDQRDQKGVSASCCIIQCPYGRQTETVRWTDAETDKKKGRLIYAWTRLIIIEAI